MSNKVTYEFVAKQGDQYFYLNRFKDESQWELRDNLSQATMYPIVSDLESDLEKGSQDITEYEIVPVEIKELK